MNEANFKELLIKYGQGECTAAEKAQLESWLTFGRFDGPVFSDEMLEKRLIKLGARLPLAKPTVKRIKLWPRVAVAAAAVAAIVIGVWFYGDNNTINIGAYDTKASGEIKPGKNTATLIAYGKAIQLSDTKTGVTINNNRIAYNDGSEISSSEAGKRYDGEIVSPMAAITPRGGQYQFTLPDGTKVWLNAASEISFPSQFKGKDRKVLLKGEAYFEVFKNKTQPFVVSTKNQDVMVLGTHFNVNAYEDERAVKTTLLEGSVNVNGTILKPDQQSILINDKISVITIDAQEAVAWKNGEFLFNKEPLGSIMNKISRWYDVEIHYENSKMEKKQFWGAITRFANVSDVLKMLELTGDVHFKIEGRAIIVKP
jgi:ferric-dicitrate binding protein FerR (iron transport regulator)